MLTKETACSKKKNGVVIPDRIGKTQENYVEIASQLLDLFKNGIGKTRRDLEREVEELLDVDKSCPLNRIKSFFKLLEDVSTFNTNQGQSASKLRKEVLTLAAPDHPLKRLSDGLWGKDEAAVKKRIARSLDRTWDDIDANLFVDMREFHSLKSFEGYKSPEHFLNRYNTAQAQAVLLWCTYLRIEAKGNFKEILRYAKLARLLHGITRLGESHYVFEFEGPASVLRETQRYGANMAIFFISLLSYEGWTLHAKILIKGQHFVYELNAGKYKILDNVIADFDSSEEQSFSESWGDQPRDGWSLKREDEVLWDKQVSFVPDFSLTHSSGRRILLEIAGFWTKEYIEKKRRTLELFSHHPILLAVPEELKDEYSSLTLPIVFYKNRYLSFRAVLAALAKFLA